MPLITTKEAREQIEVSSLLRSAALHGALAWLIYGLCESVAVAVLPGLRAMAVGDAFPMDWRVTTGFLAFYSIVGALIGLVFGSIGGLATWTRLGHKRLEVLLPSVAVASVLVIFAVNIWYSSNSGYLAAVGKSEKGALVVAPAVIIGWLMAHRYKSSARWRFALHPWGSVILLVGLISLNRDTNLVRQSPVFVKGLLSMALVTLVLILMGWIGARSLSRGSGRLIVALTTAAVVVLCTFTDRNPAPDFPEIGRSSDPDLRTPVVLIVLDTVRADRMSLYGHDRETDPNLKYFSQQAVLFHRAVMPGDMTFSSHASMFTGQLATRHGAYVGTGALAECKDTLAEILESKGFVTVAVVSNCGWMSPKHGLDQGFQYYDSRCGRSIHRGVRSYYIRETVRREVRAKFFPHQAGWRWRSAGEITNETIDVISQLAETNAPFLLFVNYMDVHRPIHPPPPFNTRFPGRQATFDMERDWGALLGEVATGERTVLSEQLDHLTSQYDGALAYIDDQIGRLFDHLREVDLFDRSLVIITSDHGESFGESGFGQRPTFGHGKSVYENVIAVPLLIKYPHQSKGTQRFDPVSGVDLAPTILEVLGLSLPTNMDGKSLISTPDEDRYLLTESFVERGLHARAISLGHDKLVLHADGQLELYDLGLDPREEDDLSTTQADLATDLRVEILDWSNKLAAKAHEELCAGQETEMSPDEVERLRALGYLQ